MSIEIQSWEKIDRGSSAEKTDFEQIISLPKDSLSVKNISGSEGGKIMRNKALSWILVISMVISLYTALPITAYAAVEGDWTYTLYDGDTTAAITGYTGTDTELVIPSVIAGKPVTRVGSNAFIDNTLITSVTIPDSVLRIESGAFQNSTVSNIDLGNGLTYIGQNAFNGSKITNVTIPDSVTQIDNNAFANNRNLTSVTINGNNLLSLGEGAFSITSLSTIRIPTSLSAIPDWAFNDTSLNSLTIPANITDVGYFAFGNNPNLNSVTFEGNAPNMGNYVFSIPLSGFTVYYYTGATGFTTPTWTAGFATLNTVELARPITYVCEVDGEQYETLDQGFLAASADEDTIKLLGDINYTGELRLIADTWINLNGFSLDVVNDSGIALYAYGHDLDISGTGSLNVTGTTFGAFIREGASVEVTNATATAEAGKAVYALDPNCRVTVLGNAMANGQNGTAVYVEGSGSSSATIHGDVFAQGTGGIGVCAVSESAITVMGRIYATNYLQVGALIKEEGEYTTLENNYYIYRDDTATVRARQEVCALNGTPYLFLEDALGDAESGDTITLLADIRYVNEIVLIEKDLTLVLGEFDLNVGRTGSDGALKVDGSILNVDFTGGGELNIVTGYVGVRALNEGSVTVTSIADPTPSNSLNGYGIIAESGSSVTVKGDIKVTSYIGEGFRVYSGAYVHVMGNINSLNGVYAGGSGAEAVVDGNISASSGSGVDASSGGTITVKGNVTAAYRGVSAYGWTDGGGTVHVLGNVTANNYYGVEASAGSEVMIDGDVQSLKGLYAIQEGSSISVGGNTTSTGADEHGASAAQGGLITIGGTITASNYIKVGDIGLAAEEGVNQGRYIVYTDGESTVRTMGIEFFKEDFESGMDGWDQSSTGWSVTSTLSNPTASSYSGSQVAMFNSYDMPYASQSRLYQTESLNLSNGSDYWLEFWMYHDTSAEDSIDSVFVQISTDQGIHWNDLGRYFRYSGTEGWTKESISLTAYAGQPDVRIAFLGMSGADNNIFIDDVTVSHECIIDGCPITEAYGGYIVSSEIGGETYYHVSTPEQLAHISDHRNLNFILTEDIDLSGKQWIPIGKTYVTSFNGCFDGNGYSISGMSITEVSGADAYGLFGNLGIDGIIENLTVESGNIIFSETVGNGCFGGIVGHSLGLVKKCVNKADITITNDDWTYAGGIVGLGNADINSYTWSARIYGCHNEGDIQIGRIGSVGGIIGNQVNSTAATYIDRCSNSGNVTGGYHAEAGGIAGRINNAGNIGIVNCFNTGNITSGEIGTNQAYVGGIVGYEYYSQVENCYNTGDVTLIYSSLGNTFCGGISGHADIAAENCYNIGTVTGTGRAGEGINGAGIPCVNCYYLDISTPGTAISGVASLTVSEMKSQSSFANWDFPDTWTINSVDNDGYPALAWQGFNSASSDATLSTLSASGITLTPEFMGETTSYAANVSNSISSTTVSTTASAGTAEISINGTIATSKQVVLEVGSNVITIEVTAEDGITTKTYTLVITRAASTSGGSSGSTTPTGQQITVSTPDGGTVVTGTLTESASTEQITINGTQFRKLADTSQGAMIPAPSATVTFDTKVINAINGASTTGDVVLTIEKLDPTTLTPGQQKRIGDRPVYDFTLTKGGQQIFSFDGGHATISIPYTLEAGENPHQVVIYYLTSDGTLKPVRGHYDAKSECVVFETTHFSTYAVVYNPISFSDVVSDTWYKDAVDFIAAREITSGTGDGAFSPEAKLTRGQFIVLLMNAYGVSLDVATAGTTNFTDAGNTYYTEYLLAAKSLGIVNGIGNDKFVPEQPITRQEMFVMLYNALSVLGELPAASGTKLFSDFEDASQIASWAQEAMDALVKGGVISGSNGMLHPGASTTRAEMSQMLYNLLSK